MNSLETRKAEIVMGLDISTACIGVSIVKYDGSSTPEILKITHIVPKIKKGIKGIEALILRKEIFENEFLAKNINIGITECVIESPLAFATGNSNAETVAQLLQFNGLISEAVYRVLHIIPNYLSSYNARILSFPKLLSIRKLNKKGEYYPISHYKKALRDNEVVPFGSFPFDCDKKAVMMDLVNEQYPNINWVYNQKGQIKKENFDACDSLVCALAFINQKINGDINPQLVEPLIETNDNSTIITYKVRVWDTEYPKSITIPKN